MLKGLFALMLSAAIALEAYVIEEISPHQKFLKPIEMTEHNSGVPLIDCIYVINLDKRTDRWDRMTAIFKKTGIKANRVSAIDGRKFTKSQKQQMCGPYPIHLSGPEIGCLLSHLSIVNDAYMRGFNAIWIMEDDVEVLEDPSIIPSFIENLTRIDKNWDLLYTDTNCKNSQGAPIHFGSNGWVPRPGQTPPPFKVQAIRTPVGSDLERLGLRYGMTSVILSRSGIEKIYNYFLHIYLWRPIDVDIHYIPDMRKYGTTRDVITNVADGLGSDIGFAWTQNLGNLLNSKH